MKLLSFIDEKNEWTAVEVELELWPGLPEIHFLGRADQHLRESAKRIKSAIRAQGYEYPIAQQILVNLRPSYLKKSSRGLELAVAAAYLMETKQIPKLVTDSKTFFYGELSLSGQVSAPQGLSLANFSADTHLVTGLSDEPLPFAIQEVSELKELLSPVAKAGRLPQINWQPPEDILEFEVGTEWARILAILSLGGHSALLAGAAGSGKTTAAKILHALLPDPTARETLTLSKKMNLKHEIRAWRPFISPHHSIPMKSLLGGGNEAHGGELARCDLGFLLLDEFLEFSPSVMESLREPLEQKRMRISRGNKVLEYPLRAQVVATTNLCPCGDFVPGQAPRQRCRFTLPKCRSYSQKISGPLLDRFEVLLFSPTTKSAEKKMSIRQLRSSLEKKRAELVSAGRTLGNSDLNEIKKRMDPFVLKHDWAVRGGSERRRNATLRIAQSLSDWESSPQIKGRHLEEALQWTVHNFEKIKRWDL